MMRLKSVFFFAMLFPVLVQANQISEDFSSRSRMDSSSTVIWNQARGLLTPPLVVKNWDDGTTVTTTTLDIGNGSHGAFNSDTWHLFATSVDSAGKIIYLNNSDIEVFQFTTFNLPENWRIEPVGDRKLVIYVQGDAVIDGVIDCSGRAGTSSTGSGVSAVAGRGGEGRCGGAAGGDGGGRYTGVAGSGNGVNGSTPSAPLTGGVAGTTTAVGAGSGGGGGGAWSALNLPGTNATSGTGVAGTRGTNHSDMIWSTEFGSSGGGGGSGSSTEAGGGGGGGGGVVILHVGGDLTVGANGFILAKGGDGGSAPTNGGGGGSGGGGSIQAWVGGAMTLLGAATDALNAGSGALGNSPGGGDGGTGWSGRMWIAVGSFANPSAASTFPPTELTFEGDARYETGTARYGISTAIDTLSTLAQFSLASVSGSSSPVLEVAGSDDAFVSDDSGWVSASQVVQLDQKRYIRFRITLNNADDVNPMTADAVQVEYTPGEKKDYEFKSSGCGMVQPPTGGGGGAGPWAFALLFLPLIVWSFARSQQKLWLSRVPHRRSGGQRCLFTK